MFFTQFYLQEFYEIQQLSTVCNSRPLYLTLLMNNINPNNRVIELASKLLMMTCCSKSRLNVITIAVSGCFVQLSPIEWSIRVPSKLYGCPNSCYKFVLDSLHKFPNEITGGICPVKNPQTHNLTSQEAMKGKIWILLYNVSKMNSKAKCCVRCVINFSEALLLADNVKIPHYCKALIRIMKFLS